MPQVLMKFDIRSRPFRRTIETHLVQRTDHFIHELYNFATSSSDLSEYDNRVQYVPKQRLPESLMMSTLPAVDVPVGFLYEDASPEPRPLALTQPEREIEVIDLSDDSQEELVVDDHMAQLQQVVEQWTERSDSIPLENVNIIDDFDNPPQGPSGLSFRSVNPLISVTHDTDSESEIEQRPKSPVPRFVDEYESDSDDVVSVIRTVPPRHLRTHEVIELSDDSDEEVRPKPKGKHIPNKKHLVKSERTSTDSRANSDKADSLAKSSSSTDSGTKTTSSTASGTQPLRSVVVVVNKDDSKIIKAPLKSVVATISRPPPDHDSTSP